MFTGGNENNHREALVDAFSIVKDIYEDILAPFKWTQLKVKHSHDLQIIKKLKE